MTNASRPQRWSGEASRLSLETSQALQPLHDDLQELSPSFDGIVYFAVDKWHTDNASAVAAVQPETDDANRFLFYEQNIAKRRVDLAATALGTALKMDDPILLKSRMNPNKHVTWAHRLIVDNTLTGGLQAAFNADFGTVPTDTKRIQQVWEKHSQTVKDVAGEFHTLAGKTDSIANTLERLAPLTPNAFIISWDLDGSTALAEENYGALRNYLTDTKDLFAEATNLHHPHFHDTGDGQDITIWLPDSVDRASTASIQGFGEKTILPLLDKLSATHREYITSTEQDARHTFDPQLHFVVGLGYVERDKHDAQTSQEYWPIASLRKNSTTNETSFTANALRALGPILNKKHPL